MSEIENRILNYLGWEGIPARYINAKQSGAIKDGVGLLPQMSGALDAFKSDKNIILLGGVGRGKSFFAYEMAYRIKLAILKAHNNHNFPILNTRASILISDFKANFSNIGATIDGVLKYHSYYTGDGNGGMIIRVKALIIDEIDDISPNDYTLLNELVISAYERIIPLILISNKDANSFFANFSDKALSRLNANSLIIQAQGEDLRKQ